MDPVSVVDFPYVIDFVWFHHPFLDCFVCYDVYDTMATMVDRLYEGRYDHNVTLRNLEVIGDIYHAQPREEWGLLWRMEHHLNDQALEPEFWFWEYGVARVSASRPSNVIEQRMRPDNDGIGYYGV